MTPPTFTVVPIKPDPSDSEGCALRAAWDALEPQAQFEHVVHLIEADGWGDLDHLMAVLYQRNPDPAEARSLMAADLAARGNWALLIAMVKQWASADDLPPDPHAMLLATLYEFKGLWRDRVRAEMLRFFIEEVESRWERPPGYEDMTFE